LEKGRSKKEDKRRTKYKWINTPEGVTGKAHLTVKVLKAGHNRTKVLVNDGIGLNGGFLIAQYSFLMLGLSTDEGPGSTVMQDG